MQREREPSSFFALATLMLLLEEIKYRICKGKRKGGGGGEVLSGIRTFFWTQEETDFIYSGLVLPLHAQCMCASVVVASLVRARSPHVYVRIWPPPTTCLRVSSTLTTFLPLPCSRERDRDKKLCVPLLFPRGASPHRATKTEIE